MLPRIPQQHGGWGGFWEVIFMWVHARGVWEGARGLTWGCVRRWRIGAALPQSRCSRREWWDPRTPPAVQHRGAQGWPGATKQELMAEELRSGCALAW